MKENNYYHRDGYFCFEEEKDNDCEIQEKLEFTFEVKDKYKKVINKVIRVYPSELSRFNVNPDWVRDILFNSININTAKVNWHIFREEFRELALNKTERKRIKKIIKNIITEEFIETDLKRQEEDYESILGTEKFDVITNRDRVVTIGNMLGYFDIHKFVRLDNLFNRGSKTYISLVEERFITVDYSENILGMMIGTLGKANENLRVHVVKTEKRKFDSNNFNFITEESDECKIVLQEECVNSMQITVLNVFDILKTTSSKVVYKNILKKLNEYGIDEMHIPIMDMSQQLSIKFSLKLTVDNEKLMRSTEQLDKILNKEVIVSIREIYVEKFKRAVFKNSIIEQYLNYRSTYDVETTGVRRSDKKRLMKQIEDYYGKDSLFYKCFYSYIFDRYNIYDVDSYISLFVSRLDEIIIDELEGGTWNFECKASNISDFVVAKIMDAMKQAGNTLNSFEMETIE